MKEIALAIMVVGLCFYNAFMLSKGLEVDLTASFFAFIGAVILILKII